MTTQQVGCPDVMKKNCKKLNFFRQTFVDRNVDVVSLHRQI